MTSVSSRKVFEARSGSRESGDQRADAWPCSPSRIELEPTLATTSTNHESRIERMQNRTFPIRFHVRGNDRAVKPTAPESEARLETVIGPDRTTCLCHIRGGRARRLITRQESARSRAVLAPCAKGVCVLPARPLFWRRCKPSAQVLDVPRGRSCRSPPSSCLSGLKALNSARARSECGAEPEVRLAQAAVGSTLTR